MCDAVATTTTATPTIPAAAGSGSGVAAGDATTSTAMEERTRQSCCRLCIAPASECISIINSYAADKEPLATKIQNCVNIKVSKPNVASGIRNTLIHIHWQRHRRRHRFDFYLLSLLLLRHCAPLMRNRYTH